jgi:hypothetical protein
MSGLYIIWNTFYQFYLKLENGEAHYIKGVGPTVFH